MDDKDQEVEVIVEGNGYDKDHADMLMNIIHNYKDKNDYLVLGYHYFPRSLEDYKKPIVQGIYNETTVKSIIYRIKVHIEVTRIYITHSGNLYVIGNTKAKKPVFYIIRKFTKTGKDIRDSDKYGYSVKMDMLIDRMWLTSTMSGKEIKSKYIEEVTKWKIKKSLREIKISGLK